MSDISLSVCIATRNRGSFIGATLESIICQAPQQVEIVVLDGASTDNTGEVVRLYQQRFPRLRYFPQDANMGVDQDFAKVVHLAQGQYCWLFSDDDLMKLGALQTVLDAIKGQFGLIIANAEVRNIDLSKVLERQRLPLSEDRIYGSNQIDQLLADVGDYLTFIGGVIIKRQLWNAREKQKYFGSFFIHAGVIFQSPLPENTLVIAKPSIAIRYGNAMWLDKYFEIWMFKWPALIWSFPHYPDSIKSRVCPREPWRRGRALLLQRAKGAYTIDTYRKWLEPRLNSFWSRIKSRAIAHVPGRVANLLAILYFTTLGQRPGLALQLVDLRNSPSYYRRLRKRAPGRSKRPAVVDLSRQFRPNDL